MKTRVRLTLEKHLADQVTAEAKSRGISKSEVLRQLLREALIEKGFLPAPVHA